MAKRNEFESWEETDVVKKQKLEMLPAEEPYEKETIVETVVVTSPVGEGKANYDKINVNNAEKDQSLEKSLAGTYNLPDVSKFEICDEMLSTSIWVETDGPINKTQLALDASSDDKLFLIRFPFQNNETAFLDTVSQTLRYKLLPQKTDLSILVVIDNVGSFRSPSYRISTVVIPDSYYTVTKLGSYSGRQVRFIEYENPTSAPTWQVAASAQDQFLLSFASQASANTLLYLMPVNVNGDKEVISLFDQMHNINVYHVTNYNQNNLPFVYIGGGGH